MLLNILSVAALLLAVSAIPAPQNNRLPPPLGDTYQWQVMSWMMECTKDYCTYKFLINGEEKKGYNPDIPGFAATCGAEIAQVGGPNMPCNFTDKVPTERALTASLKLDDSGNKTAIGTSGIILHVTYEFVEPGDKTQRWNYTGDKIIEYGGTSFKIPTTEFHLV